MWMKRGVAVKRPPLSFESYGMPVQEPEEVS